MNQEQIRTNVNAETEKRKSSGETLAQAASAYIETHYKEKFSLREMADSLFVNGSYLLRVFKKHKGYTPLAYHNHVRCEHARELLIRTGEEVSEIGETVGFVSSAHFSHVFKKTEGCTPSEYRLRHRVYREADYPAWRPEDKPAAESSPG